MRDGHWANLAETGSGWAIAATAAIYKFLGKSVCRAVLAPVVFYFYLTGGERRRASAAYLQRVWQCGALPKKPRFWQGYWHYRAFAHAALDKLAAWSGQIAREDVHGVDGGALDAARKMEGGAVILTAHVGNPEILRALVTKSRHRRVNVLVHTLHAERFNRVIARSAPESEVRLVQVTQIGVMEAMTLSAAINQGDWVVISADRTAVSSAETSAVANQFLGAAALFPSGPFVLAAALKCPVFTMFCVSDGKQFEVDFDLFADCIELPRQNRAPALQKYVALFAQRLERVVIQHPYQWFNFYDFWRMPSVVNGGGAV